VSQPLLQQNWNYQFRPGQTSAPAQPPASAGLVDRKTDVRRRPGLLPHSRLSTKQTLMVLGLAVSLPTLALLYVSAQAAVATVEYQRQNLAREVDNLRSRNMALHYQLTQAADHDRIGRFAQAAGMRPADPALESDFLALSPGPSETAQTCAWFSQGSMLMAEIAKQFTLPPLTERAEASVSTLEPAGQYARR